MDELLVAIQDAANAIATPNWADIMGVFLSLFAIIVAGFVAWRQNEISRKQTEILKKQTSISDKQNRIALFEKRFEIYNILWICVVSVHKMELIKENEDILEFLFVRLVKNLEEYSQFHNKARIYLMNCSEKLRCANFFFSEEVASYIINVSVKLLILANSDLKVDGLENYNKKKQEYFDAIKNLDENEIIRSIEEETKMI